MHPVVFLVFVLAASSSAQAALEVTASPEGGLSAALNVVRQSRKAGETGPATIIVPAGRYEVRRPLVIEAEDSGLTIRAEKNARPLFLGGTAITGFTKHEGEILKADASAIGKSGPSPRQLFFGSDRMILARYPNHNPSEPLYGGWAFVDRFPQDRAPEALERKSSFFLKSEDIRNWAHPEDVEVDIFAGYGWWNFLLPVESLAPESRKLTLATACSYDLNPHNRYHFQNALEELDSPGEWFLDSRTSTLYFWPPAPIETAEVRLINLDSFLQVKAAKEVHIEGLHFTGCHATAVTLSNAENSSVAGCHFIATGAFNSSALGIFGGRNNTARSNEIAGCGGNGISLTGGDRNTLIPANHLVINNHIHHHGVFHKGAAGVSATGAGFTIAHNLIHHGPRMGVQMSGNNITVEFNHLHHLCLETQDGGALYTGGRDWLGGRGNTWRYNRIHDVIGCGQEADGLKHPWFTFGIYPDDNTGGVDIIGNLVYRTAQAPIHMHNSRDCLVENNIFAFGAAYQFDLHGWRATDRFYTNHIGTMIAGYDSVANQPAWKTMRGMELHPKDAIREDGTMMSGNIVRRNIMFSNTPGIKYGDLRHVSPQWNTIDENLAWNGGHPVLTGLNKTGPDLGEPLLVESFAAVENGKLPKGWGFNHKPTPTVQLSVIDGSLRADCVLSDTPGNTHTVFHGPDVPIKPGAAYRARIRLKSTEPASRASIAFGSYKAGEGYWQSKGAAVIASSEWQAFETTATIPRTDHPSWKPWLTSMWVRVDCLDGAGQLLIDDLQITEAEPLDEWTAWQLEGWDRNGLVADPLFEAPAKDDFRLKADSPAITQIGFKPLPIDEMGLVEDEWRSSASLIELRHSTH